MIKNVSGNLLKDEAQALVNTVNTVGVMGKGLALQFKRAYPEVFEVYAQACRLGEVQPGRILPVALPDGRWILNFPTKRHWRQPSRAEDIEAGLDDLVRLIGELGLRSIALPPLGCGNGNLSWSVVKPLILRKLEGIDVSVHLYGPGTPRAEDMIVSPTAPKLSRNLARFLIAVDRYINQAFALGISEIRQASLLELHKIAYLMEVAGLPLQLSFEKGRFGPYAAKLDRWLASIEGHYLVGYGDGTGGARADIHLTEGTVDAAALLLTNDAQFEEAWGTIAKATLGYSYAEGMELLTSVHFLATRGHSEVNGPDAVADQLASWNDRKRRLFPPHQVAEAWEQLNRAGLLTESS